MPEKKAKIPLTGQVKLPEQLDREIDAERARLGIFKYEVVQLAWEAYKATTAPVEPAQTSNFIALTEDQLDILAILSEDPERAFLFQTVQTTVTHALEEYRQKWKPKNTRKKATSPLHDKRRPA